MTKNNQQAQE
uniref:Uncharacterized protein n=1 Tax=Anguilla anguilla TaxID=7936 RepID=A0A0E9VUQ2_ANGAN